MSNAKQAFRRSRSCERDHPARGGDTCRRPLRPPDRGGDFGGTWYWNRYPGAQCDIEAYIYLPLLEELSYVPTEKYVHAPEILAHSRAIGEHYDLYDKALFQTEVTGMRWDGESARWIVSTSTSSVRRAWTDTRARDG